MHVSRFMAARVYVKTSRLLICVSLGCCMDLLIGKTIRLLLSMHGVARPPKD